MNSLPIEIENIIMDFKYQIETTEKYNKCLAEMNNITILLYVGDTIIQNQSIFIFQHKTLTYCNIQERYGESEFVLHVWEQKNNKNKITKID